MYPLKFENLYYEKIWGGRDLELFRDNLPEGNIGESWDVACHLHGTSIVANGELKGTKLDELIRLKGKKLIGTKISTEWFPLLIKLIDTKDKLSVQVHPDNQYGKEVEGEMGKTEVWYVMEAFEGANLILGTKEGCTKEKFEKAIKEGNLDKYIYEIPVKKGEVYFVKSGLIHSIGRGVIIAEIQQNSDTTYRVYDYNRGRKLHINRALDVVDFSLYGNKSTGLKTERVGYNKTYLCLCEDFSLELYDVKKYFTEVSDVERFYVFTCVEGQGKIVYKEGFQGIKKGDSVLIPATLGEYTFKGEMKVLKSYVPDIKKVEEDILHEVKK
ncbi:class I mannose-6-phosphate isomerase [Clostridium aestuarii]|uniref:Phosphohexomutase n=1 Tax=Clostridium aestuarii TaxID=338193 RepID=A0ABT4D0E6_9CLOT|nr:type I phosphomannose isomerase catalytic subunit [Clostridium aestuarii]MCY6484713.1 class I mannose-6-phosphate isomerase [Clostridium aestuarii]